MQFHSRKTNLLSRHVENFLQLDTFHSNDLFSLAICFGFRNIIHYNRLMGWHGENRKHNPATDKCNASLLPSLFSVCARCTRANRDSNEPSHLDGQCITGTSVLWFALETTTHTHTHTEGCSVGHWCRLV